MKIYKKYFFVKIFLGNNSNIIFHVQVDATKSGGLARFINHSCEVNYFGNWNLIINLKIS